MNPLKLTPPQWRVLRYLATHSTTAARVGFRATQLRDLTGASPEDLNGLADLGHIAGRLHGDCGAPMASIVITARAHHKLRIHLTPSGMSAAEAIEAAHRALRHLRLCGPLPLATLQHDAAVGDDTLTQIERHGYTETIPGDFLAWTEDFSAHVYYARLSVGSSEVHPCQRCGRFPKAAARVWDNFRQGGDLYCDPCIPRKATVHGPPTVLIALTHAGRRYAEPNRQGQS